MTDFQVGDRVSVEGMVTQALDTGVYFKIKSRNHIIVFAPTDSLTLVDRPRKKLRVGSVWERWGVLYCVGTDEDGYKHLVSLKDGGILDASLIGVSHPECWREVPVEELERVAGQ